MWKQRRFRVFAALILSLVMLVTGVLNSIGTIQAEAASAVGKASITPGAAISYGGWSTNKFTVKAADGKSYLGYCAQPQSATPRGSYSYYVYEGENADEIKLMAWIGASNDAAAVEARNNLFAGIPNETTRYGYIHAVIGYLYSGQLTGLNSGTITGVRSIVATLRSLISTKHPCWVNARKMTLFYAPNSNQDIVWAGYGEGAMKATKAAASNLFMEFRNVYSLEGAVYGIYRDGSCTDKVREIVSDENGEFQKVGLDYGTYYLKELQAPKGFALNTAVKKFTVTSGTTTEVTLQDLPQGDPVPVLLQKKNAQTGNAVSWGDASLQGAEYTYKYYAVDKETYKSMETEEKAALEPDRTWVFRTDEGGHIQVSDRNAIDRYLVEGELFYDISNTIIYPIGTYLIQETQAPDGYLLDDTVHTVFIEGDADAVTDEQDQDVYYIHSYNEGGEAVTLTEQPVRGDFRFCKADEETGEVMAGIPFELSLLDAAGEPQETAVIYTDENGEVNTASSVHTHTAGANTGENSGGVWFGVGSQPDDSMGALPYGTYRLTELPCEKNEGKDLLIVEFIIRDQDIVLDLGTLYNRTIYIHTTAGCSSTGTATIPDQGKAELTDTVEYRNLTPGRCYVMEGTLMNAETGEACEVDGSRITNSLEFIPESDSGTVRMSFSIDASMLESGMTYVFFERLYDRESLRAAHEDPEDAGQSVYIPQIQTHAADDHTHDHVGDASGDTVITDHVEYKGLAVGETYTIQGRLVDQATGETAADTDGRPVIVQNTFKAEGVNGSVELQFPVTAEMAAGRSFTVFETLYQNDIRLAAHEELGDEEQSIQFPAISTHAEDGMTQDAEHLGSSIDETTIRDTVSYQNLIPGKEYTVKGVLMNKETGEPIPDAEGMQITGETTFVAENSNGSVVLEFKVESCLLAGETVVVFEDLLHNIVPVAIHHDLTDEEQSVHYPALHTTAVNSADGTHSVPVEEMVSITDTVEYTNLIPGKQYRMIGTLMNRESGEVILAGNDIPVVKQTDFTAEDSCGEQNLSFTINTKEFHGTGFVVFERLYMLPSDGGEPVPVARHEDLSDAGQTIYVPRLHTLAQDADTGTQEGINKAGEKILDTVSYKGLVPGETYVVKGVLMDKRTGDPIRIDGKEVVSETQFTAEESCGTVTVEFMFDSIRLEGHSIVVFETLYHDRKELIVHADLEDEDQTIWYPKKPITSVLTGDNAHPFTMILLFMAAMLFLCTGTGAFIHRKKRTAVRTRDRNQ